MSIGVSGRLAGMVLRPRQTLATVVAQPVWVTTWALLLIIWALCGAWLLSTDVGQQALVDERVRVVEAVGGTVTDAEYAALQARPPWWVYFTSGGRTLLIPAVTLVAAAGVWAAARRDGGRGTFNQALAVAVHASVVLAIGQLVATPLHAIRESLTTPLNLAALLPGISDGSWPARFFGAIDVFVVWWLTLLAVGIAVLTGRGFGRYAWRLGAAYVGLAAVFAAVLAALGGV